jgi:enamine deaminase RidA (YjgF/YER057c/UK114 family)
VSGHQILNPPHLPRPRGYSHGVVATAGKIVFVAGQIGCDGQGTIISSDIVDQFGLALENVVQVVTAAGGAPESIASMTIYVTDLVEYRARLKGLGAAWRRVMGARYPAISLVEVKALFESNAKIEIEARAVV